MKAFVSLFGEQNFYIAQNSVLSAYPFTSVVVLGPWSWSRGASRTCLGGLGLGLGLAISGLGLGLGLASSGLGLGHAMWHCGMKMA